MTKGVHTFALVAIFFSSICTSAAELSRADAIKLLTSMNHKRIAIGAIINGVGTKGGAAFSSPKVATVLGYSVVEGKYHQIELTFFYDDDLGWIYWERDDNRIGIWTLAGYKGLKTPDKPPPNE